MNRHPRRQNVSYATDARRVQLWQEARQAHQPFGAWMRVFLYEVLPFDYGILHDVQVVSIVRSIPKATAAVVKFVRGLSLRQWGIVGAVLVYYAFVRLVHYYLDAGPVVLILTALVAIFTVGLGDEEDRGGRLSAYSVFNRGFERMLGTTDPNDFLVGGLVQPSPEEEPLILPPNEHETNDREDVILDDDPPAIPDNNPNRQEEQRRQLRQRIQERTEKRYHAKSNKKGAKKEQKQQRNIQRQREAAMAYGFTGQEDSMEDMMAMQRLIEEQIAAENNAALRYQQGGYDY